MIDRTSEWGDGERPVAWTRTRRKARKRWQCVECRGEIAPGTHYVEISGVWPENGPQRFRMCEECDRWAISALHGLGLNHYPIGQLAEAIADITARIDPETGRITHYVDRTRV